MSRVVCRECDAPIRLVRSVDTGSWFRLEPCPDGPLLVDAKGRLRATASTGWKGQYKHHRCEVKS